MNHKALGPFLFLIALLLCQPLNAQDHGGNVNVTTWQQDDPATCTSGGCVYRTGANLAESTLTSGMTDATFGQLCSSTVDGQIYGQPLVVTNVQFNGHAAATVVYVVTQDGSVYAFGGTPPAPTGSTVPPCPLLAGPIPLVPTGSNETAVFCDNIGGTDCAAVAPNVGILGTLDRTGPLARGVTPVPVISFHRLVGGTPGRAHGHGGLVEFLVVTVADGTSWHACDQRGVFAAFGIL